MTIEVTEEQRMAVLDGKPLHLNIAQMGDLVILRATDYKELVVDANETAALVSVSSKALTNWCKENPY